MALLLREMVIQGVNSAVIAESADDPSKPKSYFFEGVFGQAEVENRNGRIYPKHLMEREINKYQSLIESKRSTGELNHRDTPEIDPERVSHYITELRLEGNEMVGRAKVMTAQPCGMIVKNFIDEGMPVAVSTRGVGTLKESGGKNYVQDDFGFKCLDVVFDPSCAIAFTEGIMENAKEWEFVGGKWISTVRESIQVAPAHLLESKAIELFDSYMKSLKTVRNPK